VDNKIFDTKRRAPAGAPGSGDRRALQARLQIVVDSLKATIVFNPLFASTGALLLSLPHSPFGTVAAWRLAAGVGGHLVCASVAALLYRRFRQVAAQDLDRLSRVLLLAQILFSAMWGAVAFLYWAPGNDVNHVWVQMVMAVVAFSSVFARSAYRPVMVAALAVQCGLSFLRLVSADSAVAHYLAPLMPVYVLYLMAMGRASHQRIGVMIAARFANEDLAAALAHARDQALRKRYEAETANATKTAFLANMSHELRTPLNAILGFSDIIAQQVMGAGEGERYRDYARDIHASGSHLLSLINDLLDIAKIESGKMEIDPKPLDPATLLAAVVRLMEPRAAARRQTLTTEIAPATPWLVADERACRQMLINLLSNAVKFTPEGGRITILCSAAADGLQLCVADTGPGIAADKLAHVFEPFSQIDNRFDREVGGTGLGLALVRGLARLHGGRVWLESAAGAGVKAFIYFPSTIAAQERRSA